MKIHSLKRGELRMRQEFDPNGHSTRTDAVGYWGEHQANLKRAQGIREQ